MEGRSQWLKEGRWVGTGGEGAARQEMAYVEMEGRTDCAREGCKRTVNDDSRRNLQCQVFADTFYRLEHRSFTHADC